MSHGDVAFVPFARPDITPREIDAVSDALRSGWLTTGPNAAAFEQEMCEFLESSDLRCLAVNSATAGLHLAVEALGIGPGDEVLVPTWTFTATAEVVRYVGAHPILVDIDPLDLNIDFADAKSKLTERTRAIMPVHFAGLPIDSQVIAEFAQEHGLAVVEDAAHAFPVRSGSDFVGNSSSDAVVFSFYATKTITTGEGGMVAVKSPEVAERIRTMRLHGINRDVFGRYQSKAPAWFYEVVAPGYKYNMPDMCAAMGRVQLTRAEEMRNRRRAIALEYVHAFHDLPLGLPIVPDEADQHAWHLFVVRIDPERIGMDRNQFVERMSNLGVGTSVHFIPLHLHPYWRETYSLDRADFPNASREFDKAVSLPLFSSMTEAEVAKVIESVRSVLLS